MSTRMKTPIAALSLALAVLCAHPASAQTATPTVSEALARASEALGWEQVRAHPGAVRVRGAAVTLGTKAAQVDVIDGRRRWLQTLDGPLPGASGFDGEVAWSVDWTKTPLVLELGDAVLARMNSAFLYGWWAAPESGLEFTAISRAGDAWALEFTPRGGFIEGLVLLDPETYLPSSVSWDSAGIQSTWTFEGFANHEGYRFPAHLSMQRAGLEQSLTTQSVEFLEAADEGLFAPRLEAPQDTSFDALASPELEVLRARTGHLLVHPLINGKDLGWFIFDTGAGTNCIANSVTGQLGGSSFGETTALGVGGAVTSHFWSADQLQLGPLTIEDPTFMGLDLEFLSQAFGVEVGGILGYELLARCTVEFDQTAPYIALFDPASYLLAGDGKWEEILLFGRQPCVQASFEDHEGLFKLDTGAAGDTLTLHAPVVVDLALLEGRKTRSGQAGGVGGMVAVRDGELSSFRLGGHDFGAIPASFALEEKGAFSNPHVWGNLGGRLFEPFLLVFDYPHQRLGFVLK